MLHLKVGTLYQEQGTLVLKLWMQDLYRCMTRERSSNKLIGLRKEGSSVASEKLAQKHHLVFAILFHFF
jgi:hypothetical protein